MGAFEQRAAIDMQQVEDDVKDRHGRHESRRGIVHVHAALQQLEARTADVIERDDLPVDDGAVALERVGQRREFRISRRDVDPVAAVEGEMFSWHSPARQLAVVSRSSARTPSHFHSKV